MLLRSALPTMGSTLSRSAILLLLLPLLAVCATFVSLAASNAKTTRTCVDAEAVSHASTKALSTELRSLTQNSTFFSIFRVALDKKCPFWDENKQCAIRECSVCNCAENEIPAAWRQPPPSKRDHGCVSRAPEPGPVDRALPKFLQRQQERWRENQDALVWTVRDRDSEAQFVDLRKNPEQYTGYTGAHANSVWGAIYNENCFELASGCRSGICDSGSCKEERVLYRLISGVHTSITAHLAKCYLFESNMWGEEQSIFRERIAAFPERIRNLNVAFAVVARAVAKASPHLHPHQYKYVTGDEENDAFTQNAISRVLKSSLLDPDCRKPTFDESDMFLQDSRHRLPEFRAGFRNISKIMDCVGCEKCRLWGKLQFLGLGTALRVLFDERVPDLQRNEVIALVNLLHKLSESVLWVDKMEAQERRKKVVAKMYVSFGAAFAFTTIVLLGLMSGRSKKDKTKSNHKSQAGSTPPLNARQRATEQSEEIDNQAAGESTQDDDISPNQSQSELKKTKAKTKVRKRARHAPKE